MRMRVSPTPDEPEFRRSQACRANGSRDVLTRLAADRGC